MKTTAAHRSRSSTLALVGMLLFLAVCALGGGSARADTLSLLIVRPAAVVATALFLLMRPGEGARSMRAPLLILALLAAVIAVQLVPLPPAIWSALPQRHGYLEAARLIGQPQPWRPLALVPVLTLNSLLALLPALALLTGFGRLTGLQRRLIPLALIVTAVLSAAWGIVQVGGGSGGAAYLYRQVSPGLPDGFFANRNHQAVFLGGVLPLLAVWATVATDPRVARRRFWIAVAVAGVLVLTTLATASRAGIVLGAFSLCDAAFLLVRSDGWRWNRRVSIAVAGLAGGVVAIVLLASRFGRGAGFARFAALHDPNGEMRYAAFPITRRIAVDYLPWGSGFGSFDTIFRIYEPDRLLKPSYFNAAHNDLLELTITAGAPGLIVLLVFLGWYASRCVRLIRGDASDRSPERRYAQGAAMLVGVLLLASLSDYPLRTPLGSAILALACALVEAGWQTRTRARDGEPLSRSDASGRAREGEERRVEYEP